MRQPPFFFGGIWEKGLPFRLLMRYNKQDFTREGACYVGLKTVAVHFRNFHGPGH